MSEQQGPGGCSVVLGVISIIFGVILGIVAFPVGLLPALAFIGGGSRLVTGSGAL